MITRVSRLLLSVLFLLGLATLALAAFVAWRNRPLDVPPAPARPAADATARGAYLARAGDCIACHTAPGSAPYAGGRAVDTPFGTVFAPNLTPDAKSGLGTWSADDFWRALHEGRARDGRLLYPAFPYPHYTRMPRAEVDALYAYLRTLTAVYQPARPHALRFPYNTQAALAVWRALYFDPGVQVAQPARGAAWNRGAYLVEGPAHCFACHGSRSRLGGLVDDESAGGSLLPVQRWYAPSLHAADQAGVADWPIDDIVTLLRTGQSARGRVQGPMAEVVYHGTQYLAPGDLAAMATYLKALPQRPTAPVHADPAPPAVQAAGAQLYRRHCADCHGEQGQGSTGGAYPALAGNRIVTMEPPDNLIRMVLEGGFGPSTEGRPRPYGMPPFEQTLNDAEVAALLSWLRGTWGHHAAPVSPLDVLKRR